MPEPLAQGDLGHTPFAHVLLYIEKRALAGTLVVWRPQPGEERPKQDRILFDRGVPVAGRLIDPASQLDFGLLPLFARTSGPYAFYEGIDLVGSGESVRRKRIDVVPLIAASLRGSSRDEVVGHVVASFGDAKLRLELGVDLDRFGLLPDERACVDLLRAEPMSVAQLVEASPLAPHMTARLVYLLALTRSVAPWSGETKPTSAPPAPPPRSERRESVRPENVVQTRSAPPPAATTTEPTSVPAPPPGLSAELSALWNEIAVRAVAIDNETYFEMLGVPRDVPASDVQKAYLSLAKKWHPDRLPRELAALRPHVEQIFRHLTRAAEVLSDEQKRGRYLASVQDGGGTPAKDRALAAIVQAAMEFRKVEVLVRRRELNEALALLDRVLSMHAEDPDYHAMRAWIVFQQSLNDEGMRAVALASIERALALSPTHDKALYYKGLVLQRAGKDAEAAECFRRAAELNPKNIDAARMVRLARMRGDDTGAHAREPTQKRDSLLGKLFGSPKKK